MKNYLPSWGVAIATCPPLMAAAQPAKTEAPKVETGLTYGMEMPAVPAASASAAKPMKKMPSHDGHNKQGGKP